MESSGGQKLKDLAQRLRLYKRPYSPSSSDDEEEQEDTSGKLVSQVVESAAPIPCPPKFKSKRGAVLICLFEGDAGDLRVFLTKRSSKLSTHSGEVSLPGGKADEKDADDCETALREANEEIGLDPSLVTVVATLEPFLSKYLLRVIPVIGILSNKEAFKPVLNTDEVETLFDAPLEMFLKDENHRWEKKEWKGNQFILHFFDFKVDNKEHIIWGLTAGILVRAASVVFQQPPQFEEQNLNIRFRGSFTEGDHLP